MKNQMTKKKYLFFTLLCVLTPLYVSAEVSLGSRWKELMSYLNLDLTKEVNSVVAPVKRQCIDQNLGKSAGRTVAQEDNDNIYESGNSNIREKIMANYTKLGGDPVALKQSLCFFDKYKNTNFKASGDPSRPSGIKIDNQRYITINDLNVRMSKSRFYVIDMVTGKVNTYFSAHGYGGKKGVAESDMMAEADGLSNIDGSNATPRGFFITGSRREGSSDPKQRWKFSMKLHGVQQGVNDKSFSRAIVMHSFPNMPSESASSDDPYVNGPLRSEGPFSLSQGCPMLSPKYASEIVNKIKASTKSSGGSLYYNYSSVEKGRGPSYCGEEKLMKK